MPVIYYKYFKITIVTKYIYKYIFSPNIKLKQTKIASKFDGSEGDISMIKNVYHDSRIAE